MEKEEYVLRAREILDRDRPRFGLVALVPLGGRPILKRLAAALRQTITDLRALDPPAGDLADVERHFIGPLVDLADHAEVLLSRPDSRRLGMTAALAQLSEPAERAEDRDFCVAYGLYDHSARSGPWSFEERAHDAGVDLGAEPLPAYDVGERERRLIASGGLNPSGFWLVVVAFGLLCAAFGSSGGAAAAIIAGSAGFVVFGAVFWRGYRRYGRAVDREGREASPGLALVHRFGRQWRATVVAHDSPDTPVSATLTWFPPRKWRGKRTLALVVGKAQPGHRFAVVFSDGSLVVAAKDARPDRWPPLSLS